MSVRSAALDATTSPRSAVHRARCRMQDTSCRDGPARLRVCDQAAPAGGSSGQPQCRRWASTDQAGTATRSASGGRGVRRSRSGRRVDDQVGVAGAGTGALGLAAEDIVFRSRVQADDLLRRLDEDAHLDVRVTGDPFSRSEPRPLGGHESRCPDGWRPWCTRGRYGIPSGTPSRSTGAATDIVYGWALPTAPLPSPR